MGKPSAPPPPDYTPIAQASQMNNETALKQLDLSSKQLDLYNQQATRTGDMAQQQFDWAKQAYQDNKNQNQQVIQADIATQQAQNDAAARAQKHYDEVYQPLEDHLVSQARDYNSPERRALEMGKASATVAQTFDSQRQAAAQNLEQFGVDPTSTRAQALDLSFRSQKAAAQAAAANNASSAVDAQGQALITNAVNVGRGYPSAISTSYNTGTGAGAGAANTGLATTSSGASTMGTSAQFYGLSNGAMNGGTGAINAGTGALGAGNQALSGWGNALNNGYSNQMQAYQANQSASSGFGSLLGAAAPLAMAFLAEGGAVPHFDDGGPAPQADVPIPNAVPTRGGAIPVHASPSRGHVTDDVPAMLNAGEFVIPRDAMQWKGEEFFQKLIQKTREDRHQNSPAQPTMRRMALPARG